MATTPPAGLLDWEQTPQVLLYERAARGLKLERSGFAAVPGRSRLTWRRAEVSACLACASPSTCQGGVKPFMDCAGNIVRTVMETSDHKLLHAQAAQGPKAPFLRTCEACERVGAKQADGARAAPELAMPRRAPGQHPDAGAVSAPQLSTPARRRAVIPTVHSSTSVLRGGVRAKARPARLVRMGGAVYRVAAGRSLQRQPGTPRLGPVLRSAAKVQPPADVPASHCRQCIRQASWLR